MNLILSGKEYVALPVKARMFRKAIELTESMDPEQIKTKDLDAMIDFLVEAYGNQFSRDDVYDGLESTKLMTTLTSCITSVVGGVTGKAESKNV
jgi:hypothetical protein